jgi:SAM-dependent methyltransferase
MAESTLGRAYRVLYEFLCGRHPHELPWHWQWLQSRLLNRDFREHLPALTGSLLDIGCGQKPYRSMLGGVSEYVGADISAGPEVDVLITPNQPLPLPDDRFDAMIMTQVMQYVDEPSLIAAEIRRVLKPGGVAIVTYPFIFNEGGPHDDLRLSANAAEKLFVGFKPVKIKRQGGIGSTMATLFLNWVNQTLNLNFPLRLIRPLLLPVWLPLCLLINLLAILVDILDRTRSYYCNVFAMLEKNGQPG